MSKPSGTVGGREMEEGKQTATKMSDKRLDLRRPILGKKRGQEDFF